MTEQALPPGAKPLPPDASYGDICRELVRRACFFEDLQVSELGRHLGIDGKNTSTVVYRGELAFPKALELAEMARATVPEMAQMERAWLRRKADKDVRGVLTRCFRMIERYREEMENIDAFLKEQGLWEEYVKRRGWDHELGLVQEEKADEKPAKKQTRKRRSKRELASTSRRRRGR